MKFSEIINGLTIEQAKAWNETSEKFLYIDYEILAPLNINALDCRDTFIDAIEEKLLSLLGE